MAEGPGPADRVLPVKPPQWAELSPEQQQEAADAAGKLLVVGEGGDETLLAALQIMIVSRHLYYAALAAVHERIEKQSLPVGLEAFLAGSVASQAMEPFTRQELLERMQKFVLEWLVREIRRDAEIEQAERHEQLKAVQSDRLALKIPCGWHWRDTGTTDSRNDLDRGRVVAVLGGLAALQQLLGEAAEAASKTRVPGTRTHLHVLTLSQTEFKLPALKRTYEQRAWPASRWKAACVSNRAWQKALQPAVDSMVDTVVDLLVIEDITQLVPPHPATKSFLPSEVLQALQTVARWAQGHDCAVVVGLPCDWQDVPAFSLAFQVGEHLPLLDSRSHDLRAGAESSVLTQYIPPKRTDVDG
jgi:hypothetical protein